MESSINETNGTITPDFLPALFSTEFQRHETTHTNLGTDARSSDERFYLQHSLTSHEQGTLLAWTLLIALVTITGNSFILVSSVKYNAIRLDRISIILIRNLAASDLGQGLYFVTLVAPIVTQRNVYGDLACYALSSLSHVFMGTSTIFLSALTTSKLTSLISPLRSNIRRYRRGRRISYAIWCLMVLCIAVLLSAALLPGHFRVRYSSASFKCISDFYKSGPLRSITIVIVVGFSLAPLITNLVTTPWMIFYVAKVRGINRQAVLTLLGISAAYFLFFLPTAVFYLLDVVLTEEEKSSYWFALLFRFAIQAANMNSFINPLIYFITIHSFEGFVKMITGKFWERMARSVRRAQWRVIIFFSVGRQQNTDT